MMRKVTVRLANGETVEHTYPDMVIAHDGVLTIQTDRSGDVQYPLTSVLSWSTER